MKTLRVKWGIDDHSPAMDTGVEEIKVDAGNIEEMIEKDVAWVPDLDEQIERLVQEWSDPKSDGTGVLTFSPLMTESMKSIREEIDKEILNSLMITAKRAENVKKLAKLVGYEEGENTPLV